MRWLLARQDSHDEMWVGIRGPLRTEGVDDILEDRARMAGIRHIWPHLLRHTFGPMFLKNGGDVFHLQRLLGHSSLEMVRKYVLLADTDVMESHRRNSPVDRMKL